MGGPRAVRLALAALLLAASAACHASSAQKVSGPTATVATEPAPTTTTNPYAVPPVIDAAYVNKVLAGLDAIRGDVTRQILAAHTIPRDAYDRMRAIYGDDNWLQLRIDSFQSDIRRNFAGYSATPGNQVTTVVQLLSRDSTCIFARVRRDYSAIGPGASTTSDQNWVALKPLDESRDPGGYNATSWALVYDGFPEDRSEPSNPCAK